MIEQWEGDLVTYITDLQLSDIRWQTDKAHVPAVKPHTT